MKENIKIQSEAMQSSTGNYEINKPLKLNTVSEGEPTDNVLVYGADKEVKSIPRNEFGGGSQDLQQTLENGNIASFDSNNSKLKFLEGDENNRVFEAKIGDGFVRSSLSLGNTYASLSHSEPAPGHVNSNISATSTGIILSNNDNGTNAWYNMFFVPYNTTSQTTYSLPIDKPNGNYTLATTDDISGGSTTPTLQQVVETGEFYFDPESHEGNATCLGFYGTDKENVAIIGRGSGLLAGTNEFTLSTTASGLNATILRGRYIEGKNLNFELPEDKDSGTYTLATLNDITGGSQNLQQVLDQGSYGRKGHTEVSINDDSGAIITSSTDGTAFARIISKWINNSNCTPELQSYNVNGSTTVSITPPIAFTNIMFPAKSTAGDYTVATLDDLVWSSGTGPNSIKASNGGSNATGSNAVAQGNATLAAGNNGSHSEGNFSAALGDSSHAEGTGTLASGQNSHAEGTKTIAQGNNSHAEGQDSKAMDDIAHAEGLNTQATAVASHSEGSGTVASGYASHAQGSGSKAEGMNSHAEGQNTIASGPASHSQGSGSKATGFSSHAGGNNSEANGMFSFVHGLDSKANGENTIVFGKNIIGDSNDTAYVDFLNIKRLGTGNAVNGIGLDANGNIVESSISGNFTPTITAIENVKNLAVLEATYSKVGNIVTARVTFVAEVNVANTRSGFFLTTPTSIYNFSANIGTGTVVNVNDNDYVPAICQGFNTNSFTVSFYPHFNENQYQGSLIFQYSIE